MSGVIKPFAGESEATKSANAKSEYSEDQLLELLRCVDDPLYFMRSFMKVQHPLKGAIPFEPYPFQERLIDTFHNNRLSIALTARQMGKALALDTPIPTPTGWTTMGDLRVGDLVLGDDGQPARVSFATDVMHDHTCYEVEFDNGEVIVADAEHLWRVGSTVFRDGEPRVLTTEELRPWLEKAKRQGQGLHIATADPFEGERRNLPVEPYTLGVWLGDGYSDGGRFCGHVDDCVEMREHVAADGYALSGVGADRRNNTRYQTVYGLASKLRTLGILGAKRIPEVYLRASVEQRLELLRGLMDTGGHAASTGGFDFYQKDKALAEQVFELVASLGMKPRLRSKIVNGDTYWKVRFATTRFEVFKLARKNSVARNMKGHPKNHRFFVKDIRPTASVPVRCIQVDNESHMFLCGRSMIPTHNTTVAAGYLLWKAMFTPDTTILICANKLDQALEIMQRVRYSYENLPDYIRAGVTEYNKGSISFDNGSRIVSRATTPDAGRGLSITLLYLDEFAFVQPRMAKEFWTSIQPVLSTGGSCIITSTPKSDEDQFAQIWKGAVDNRDDFGNETPDGVGRNGYKAIMVKWDEHPERDEEWAKPFRETLGEARFRQEFCCDFVSDDETLINPLTLAHLKGVNPIFFTDHVRWYREPEPNRSYLVALDPSVGTGRDYAAIQVFQMPEMVQVAEWQHNTSTSRQQVRVLLRTLLFLDDYLRNHHLQHGDPEIFWTVENNSLGEAVLQVIEDTGEERFPGSMVHERKRKGQSRRFRKGLTTMPRNKLAACARLKSLVESGRMEISSSNLLKEFKSFVARGGSYGAKSGETDDLVMATVLVVRMLDTVLHWGAEAGDLREHIADEELGEDEPMPVVV